MAAKCKVIKTLNEFNHLTSEATLGNKIGTVIFYNGGKADWKQHLSDLHDLAGDFFDEASFIGVDARFFPQIMQQLPGAAEGKACLFKKNFDNAKAVDFDVKSIREAVKSF